MYKVDDNGSSFVGYIKEEENQELYDYARSIKLVKEELEKVFIGKTETEVKQKITDGKFNEFLQANSDIIISAEGVRCYPEPNGIDIDSITFKNGDKEQTLSGDTDNYSIEIYLKNGTFYKVNVSYGT